MNIGGPNSIPPSPSDLHVSVHHRVYSQTKSTFAEKLMGVVRQVMGAKAEVKPNPQLMVGIYEVHTKSKQAVSYLENVKLKLSKNVADRELLAQAETAIDSMIKEIGRIRKGITTTTHPLQQEELLSKYFHWVENVRFFMDSLQEQGVEEAVKQQGIRSVTDLINRDIDFLEKLFDQDMPQASTQVAKEQLRSIFEVSISALENLKEPPDSLTVDQLSTWEVKLRASRETVVNEALAQIERIMEREPGQDKTDVSSS